MIATLVSLFLLFAQLSVLAFGGGNTILPEMQRQVVDVHHWMSATEFSALFALAQAAPGPNMMVVVLVGWQVAGFPGLLVSAIAKFGPSSIITGLVMHAWERFKDHPWRRHVQRGLVPMTAGLVVASAWLILESTAITWALLVLSLVVAVLAYRTKLHPLWLLAGSALAGMVLGVF